MSKFKLGDRVYMVKFTSDGRYEKVPQKKNSPYYKFITDKTELIISEIRERETIGEINTYRMKGLPVQFYETELEFAKIDNWKKELGDMNETN